jgi:DNA replication and repair protein RecF
MRINHLSLVNFRNYSRLELDLPAGVILLLGDNAQGKTNLLEAIYLLSRMRSSRTSSERELVNWLTLEEDLPFARLSAQVQRGDETDQVEVSLVQNGLSAADGNGNSLRKHIRVNGAARRATDVVGLLSAVLFMPEDIDIVAGSPGGRRRYLDDTLCQVDTQYCRELQRYTRVLTERNFLLRSMRSRRFDLSELTFWDEKLIEHGSYLVWKRHQVLRMLGVEARRIHLRLTGNSESLDLECIGTVESLRAEGESDQLQLIPTAACAEASEVATARQSVSETFVAKLREMRSREIEQGVTLVGPHRDDLRFWVNGVDMNPFGSRGQQRTVALSMKLAELELVAAVKEDRPVLLLDDVVSELDEEHRKHLFATLGTVQQVVMTATDLVHFSADFVAGATVWRVTSGRIEAESSPH